MLRSNANPELWGLSLNLPLDIQLFQYRYVLYDSESLPYFDSESMRTIDVPFQLASAVTIGEINVEDKIVTVMPFRG